MRRRARVSSLMACVTLLLAAIVLRSATRAEEGKLPLSVPIKSLVATKDESEPAMSAQAMAGRPDRPEPTTPGGKLPQYQLDRRHLALPTAEQRNNPRLRLIVAMPSEPILIEAVVTIDNQHFSMLRERRIAALLRQVDSSDHAATAADNDADNATSNADTASNELSSNRAANAALTERIARYRQAGARPLSADELRWLLANWVDGPTLLVLNDNFQRFRAGQRPVFDVLDDNRDGTVDSPELARAVEAFRQCDANHNDIVEYTELAEVASDPRRKRIELAGRGKLVFLLPDESSSSDTYRRLAMHYAAADGAAIVPRWDANSDGSFDADELSTLAAATPDVSLLVAFDATSAADGRLTVTALGQRFADQAKSGRAEAGAITLSMAGAELAFSAVQGGASDQISLGAVVDGYPLLPRIDPNEDGRFTLRELRDLPKRLRTMDLNQDGRLTSDEAPRTIRVCFALGPLVHRELASIRTLQPAEDKPALAGPEWFVRMDRNHDNDLARGEFPGTDEQFAELDADGDKLISAEEANRFDAKASEAATNSKPTDPQE